MKVTKNVLKGCLTSTIGLTTMLVTLFLILGGSMDFVWGGIAGLSIGTVLLLSPDTIVVSFGKILSRMVGKGAIESPDISTDNNQESNQEDKTNTRKD